MSFSFLNLSTTLSDNIYNSLVQKKIWDPDEFLPPELEKAFEAEYLSLLHEPEIHQDSRTVLFETLNKYLDDFYPLPEQLQHWLEQYAAKLPETDKLAVLLALAHLFYTFLNEKNEMRITFYEFWSPLAIFQPLLPLERVSKDIINSLSASLARKNLSIPSIPFSFNLQSKLDCIGFIFHMAKLLRGTTDHDQMQRIKMNAYKKALSEALIEDEKELEDLLELGESSLDCPKEEVKSVRLGIIHCVPYLSKLKNPVIALRFLNIIETDDTLVSAAWIEPLLYKKMKQMAEKGWTQTTCRQLSNFYDIWGVSPDKALFLQFYTQIYSKNPYILKPLTKSQILELLQEVIIEEKLAVSHRLSDILFCFDALLKSGESKELLESEELKIIIKKIQAKKKEATQKTGSSEQFLYLIAHYLLLPSPKEVKKVKEILSGLLMEYPNFKACEQNVEIQEKVRTILLDCFIRSFHFADRGDIQSIETFFKSSVDGSSSTTSFFYLPLIKELIKAKTKELVLLAVNLFSNEKSLMEASEYTQLGFQLYASMQISPQNLFAMLKLLTSIKTMDPSTVSLIDKHLQSSFKLLLKAIQPTQEFKNLCKLYFDLLSPDLKSWFLLELSDLFDKNESQIWILLKAAVEANFKHTPLYAMVEWKKGVTEKSHSTESDFLNLSNKLLLDPHRFYKKFLLHSIKEMKFSTKVIETIVIAHTDPYEASAFLDELIKNRLLESPTCWFLFLAESFHKEGLNEKIELIFNLADLKKYWPKNSRERMDSPYINDLIIALYESHNLKYCGLAHRLREFADSPTSTLLALAKNWEFELLHTTLQNHMQQELPPNDNFIEGIKKVVAACDFKDPDENLKLLLNAFGYLLGAKKNYSNFIINECLKSNKLQILFQKQPKMLFGLCLSAINRLTQFNEVIRLLLLFTPSVQLKSEGVMRIVHICKLLITNISEIDELINLFNYFKSLPTNLEYLGKPVKGLIIGDAIPKIFEIELSLQNKSPKKDKRFLTLKKMAFDCVQSVDIENHLEKYSKVYLFHLTLDLYANADPAEHPKYILGFCKQIEQVFQSSDRALIVEFMEVAATHSLGIFQRNSALNFSIKDYIGNIIEKQTLNFVFDKEDEVTEIGELMFFLLKMERLSSASDAGLAHCAAYLESLFEHEVQFSDSVLDVCGDYFFQVVMTLMAKLGVQMVQEEKNSEVIFFEYNVLSSSHPVLKRGLLELAIVLIRCPHIERINAAIRMVQERFNEVISRETEGNKLSREVSECLTFLLELIEQLAKSTITLLEGDRIESAKSYYKTLCGILTSRQFQNVNFTGRFLAIYENTLLSSMLQKGAFCDKILPNMKKVGEFISNNTFQPVGDTKSCEEYRSIAWVEKYKKSWSPHRITLKQMMKDYLMAVTDFNCLGKVTTFFSEDIIEEFVAKLIGDNSHYWDKLNPMNILNETIPELYEIEKSVIELLMKKFNSYPEEGRHFFLYILWWRIKMVIIRHPDQSNRNVALIESFSHLQIESAALKQERDDLLNHLLNTEGKIYYKKTTFNVKIRENKNANS